MKRLAIILGRTKPEIRVWFPVQHISASAALHWRINGNNNNVLGVVIAFNELKVVYLMIIYQVLKLRFL